MYDVVIVGLGPAGATLARLLGSDLRVACIDRKSDREDSFEKPCGGLLAPDAQKELARFSLTLPTSVISSPQIFSVRTLDLRSGLTRHYQRFYINVNRHRFDRWLVSLIPPTVELLEDSRCTAVERVGDGWRVTCEQGDSVRTLDCRYLVGADGAHSLVRRTLYPNHRIRSYTSIQQWFVDRNARPFYSCVFDEANTDCYSWAISKDDVFIFGGAYPSRDCRARFERQKQQLASHGFHFGEAIRTEACLVLRPASPWQLCCGRDNAFLVGEAGGFISPSSLEGISSAIATASRLATILNRKQSKPNRRYLQATVGMRLRLLTKLAKCPFMYNPTLRRLVLGSGLDSIEVLH